MENLSNILTAFAGFALGSSIANALFGDWVMAASWAWTVIGALVCAYVTAHLAAKRAFEAELARRGRRPPRRKNVDAYVELWRRQLPGQN